jgi:hypothetical protein
MSGCVLTSRNESLLKGSKKPKLIISFHVHVHASRKEQGNVESIVGLSSAVPVLGLTSISDVDSALILL